MDAPSDGTWIAYFIEFKFVNKNALPVEYNTILTNEMLNENRAKNSILKLSGEITELPKDIGQYFAFTTEVSIWPNTFPYPDCTGAACGYRIL